MTVGVRLNAFPRIPRLRLEPHTKFSSDVPPRRDSSAAQILIYVISSDKLLKWLLRERPGDGRAQLQNTLRRNEECFQSAVGFRGSSASVPRRRSTRRTDGRREKQGRNVTKPNFARFLLEETLRDDPRIHLRKLSSALKFQGFEEMVNAEGDAARTQEPPSSSADTRLHTSH